MQHNEDLCVMGSGGSWLEGIGINKHMQSSHIRELPYIAQNLLLWLYYRVFSHLKNFRINKHIETGPAVLYGLGRTFLIFLLGWSVSQT